MGTASKVSARSTAAGANESSQRSTKGAKRLAIREVTSARGKRAGRIPKPAKGAPPRNSVVYMTSTEAQNGFGRVLDTVAHEGTVLITKRNATQAVVMSVGQYEALMRGTTSDLDELTAEFDSLLLGMQSPEARRGMRDAFRASPDELSRAAVAAARKKAG